MGFPPLPKTAPCQTVLGHWQALRGQRLRPRHSEVDPTALIKQLKNLAIFEVRAPNLTVCRLAGTAFRLSLGFELTGQNVIPTYAPALRGAAGWRFWMMATHPCAATVEMAITLPSGAAQPHEILLLPLEPDRADAPPMLLVGMAGIEPMKWENTDILPQPEPLPTFRFIDIGAGIPEHTTPQDEEVAP